MVASDEEHLVGIPNFDAEKQCHDFQAMRASIHKVANENIVNEVHVSVAMIGLAVATGNALAAASTPLMTI